MAGVHLVSYYRFCVDVCMCMCVSDPEAIIVTRGMIQISYKGSGYYMAAVIIIGKAA